MNIDKMIQQWEEKHSSLLNEYSKGNANNEVMQLYRSQMKNVLAAFDGFQFIAKVFRQLAYNGLQLYLVADLEAQIIKLAIT